MTYLVLPTLVGKGEHIFNYVLDLLLTHRIPCYNSLLLTLFFFHFYWLILATNKIHFDIIISTWNTICSNSVSGTYLSPLPPLTPCSLPLLCPSSCYLLTLFKKISPHLILEYKNHMFTCCLLPGCPTYSSGSTFPQRDSPHSLSTQISQVLQHLKPHSEPRTSPVIQNACLSSTSNSTTKSDPRAQSLTYLIHEHILTLNSPPK